MYYEMWQLLICDSDTSMRYTDHGSYISVTCYYSEMYWYWYTDADSSTTAVWLVCGYQYDMIYHCQQYHMILLHIASTYVIIMYSI